MLVQEPLLILKKRLAKLMKIPLRQQKLYFRGEELHDSRTFSSYHIHNDSLITLRNNSKHKELTICHTFISEEKTLELDSPRQLTNRVSMVAEKLECSLSMTPLLRLTRSVRADVKEEDLGYEVKVTDTEKNTQ